jgi:DNA transposition AAA+ family ATPase
MYREHEQSPLLPFIKTVQYKKFAEVCYRAIECMRIALIYGYAGAGKSSTALQFATEQPIMTVNGQSPVLYIQLSQSDKTDRAVYNKMVAVITNQIPRNDTASVAFAELVRLLKKYRYILVILDEVGFLQDSGLEAIRTLHDTTNLPIVLITMPEYVYKVQKFKQVYSRIARRLPFENLTREQIKQEILPRVAESSHITFSPEQDDVDEIVEAMYVGSDRGSFRDIVHILEESSDLLAKSIAYCERESARNPKKKPLEPRRFDVSLIHDAIMNSKGIDVKALSEDDTN